MDYCDGPWQDWWAWPEDVPCPSCGGHKVEHDLDMHGRWWLAEELEDTEEVSV